MGEFSKYVGEVGEEIVNDFLTLFRWKNMCSNKELPCCTPSHSKNTHGIDALYIYNSPLQKQSLVSVVVSAKYSSNPYTNIRATFKSHFKDIAMTIECYAKSKLKRDLTKQFKGSSRKDDIGVLFYINNIDNENNNIKQFIASTKIESDLKFSTIHVIDNARADFLYSSLTHINNIYPDYDFFCLTTSLNVAAVNNANHSKVMPVEYITSPIIPLSVSSDTGKKIILLCDFSFSHESLTLTYKLAKKLCSEFANHYEIYFKDFNKLEHLPTIDEVKMVVNADEDTKTDSTLKVDCYNKDFRS